jgi:hypothetical protein
MFGPMVQESWNIEIFVIENSIRSETNWGVLLGLLESPQ